MFARGSTPWILGILTPTVLFAAATPFAPLLWIPTLVLAAVSLFFLWFFRDPERAVGEGVVSPADGKVLSIEGTPEGVRLSIFMTPWSVHVNRSPLEGRVQALEYHRGGHVPAFRKESARNERLEVDLSTPAGPVRVRLIAGTVARRIHPYLETGGVIKKGERIGLIAFGSRCELLLPAPRYRFTVQPGDWLKAGETTVATEVQ